MNERLEQLADILFGKVMGWERNALWRIGMRLKKIKSLSYADLQAINNAAFVNKDIKAIIDELAELTAQNVVDVIEIYSEMLDKQHEENKELYEYRDKPYVPFYANEKLQAIVTAYAKATAETMINLSMTKAQQLGTIDADGNFIPIDKSFNDILDKAVMSVATGTGDVNSEMRGVLKELGGSGIRVNYGNGVTRRLGTMVRQNLLWGAKQVSNVYSEKIAEELDCDGIEIDFHTNPRPSHEFMQGKQYSINGKKTINGITYENADKALAALDDYGCLHFKTPIILGVSEPRYSPEELKRLNEENAKPITIDGVTKSGYEWKQTMRRLETEGRNTKEQYELLKASGDNIGAQQLHYKLGAIENKYSVISNATGIKAQPQRMSFVKGKTLTTNMNKSIIKSNSTKLGEKDVQYVGKIDKRIIESEFGKVQTDEVVLTNERIQHIKDHHPDDYEIFDANKEVVINNPDIVLKDGKNDNTVFMIKHIDKTNLNVIVKIAIEGDDKHPKNSIMTAHRVRDRNVKKLKDKNKTLYKKE